MVKPEIIEMTSVNVSELKDEIKKIEKRDGELNYRAKHAEDYINSTARLSGSKAKELFKKLNELNVPRLKDTHLNKLIDILPINVEDAKLIFQGQPITINNDNLKKIISIIDLYR